MPLTKASQVIIAEAVTIRSARTAIQQATTDTVIDVGLHWVRQGYGVCIADRLDRFASAHRSNPRFWQMAGLAARQAGNLEKALTSFERAATLAPRDPLLALSHAQSRFEAGLDAVDAYKVALQLEPGNGAIILGLCAALRTEGRASDARALVEHVIGGNPLWADGHRTLIHLSWLDGDGAGATRLIDAVLSANPTATPLWGTLINVWMEADRYTEAHDAACRAIAATGMTRDLQVIAAICQSESGDIHGADLCFSTLGSDDIPAIGVRMIRHALRHGRMDTASALLEQGLATSNPAGFWPYATLIWRAMDDPRFAWLVDSASMIRRHTLPADVMLGLRDHLLHLHPGGAEPVNQSVRGGTQTERPLFASIHPAISRLRAAITAAIRDHVDALPPPDATHPLLRANRSAPILYSGSWSVRLRAHGNHVPHIHPQGWLSSALYVALPDLTQDNHDGCFVYGQCTDIMPDLPPQGIIRPAVGTLVLFPSYVWHATVPFSDGERLTAAFDVAQPLD